MKPERRPIRIAALLVATVAVGVPPARAQKAPRVREVTPEARAALAAVKLVNGSRPPGGYLYPDRVGDRWQLTKEFHYSYGVPIEVMSQWAPYVTPAPKEIVREMARLQDEDPAQPGFQTTAAGKRCTLDPARFELGAVSVRDLGAVGDGRHDDTDAVQLAIDFARDNSLVCWFPAGDYLVSRTLLAYHLYEIWGNGTLHAAHMNHICLVGPSHGPRARIVLKEGTFAQRLPGRRRFVIWSQHLKSMRTLGSNRRLIFKTGPLADNDSASNFCPAIRHLDIVVRPGNAGASGLYFVAAENSTLRDVRVIFEPNPDGSPNGEAGFSGLPGSGGSVHNLLVQGGAVAIELTGEKEHPSGVALGPWARSATRPAPTVSNSEFIGQTEAAVRGSVQGTLTLVGCRFAMATAQPAVQLAGRSPESTPAIIDSVFEYPDAAPAKTVVGPPGRADSLSGFYMENCYVKNAAALEPDGAGPLRKAGWYHVRRAARTRRDASFTEPLRVPDKPSGKWEVWRRTDPRCTVENGQLLFEGQPIRLPEKATWKADGDGIAVTWLLGEPVVRNGQASFAPLLEGQPVEPGPWWETLRRAHLYRRELGFDTPGLVNVKEFGAVGDGKTDDTAALRRAAASGKDLLLPRGTYSITGPLELRPGQTVVGMDKCWSVVQGIETNAETVFGGAPRASAAGRQALTAGVPLVATAADDAANNTLCDLGVALKSPGKDAGAAATDGSAAFLLLVRGGGCEAIDILFRSRYGPTFRQPVLQVSAGGGVRIYNGCYCGGKTDSIRDTYLLLRNERHPVHVYHLQIQGPNGFGLRMAGSTGGMRAYGIKSEHGTHCLLIAENSRNFGWYGYGAGGAPRPDGRKYEDLPPAHYRMENCDDFLVAAYSQRIQHLAFLTYDGIRETRNGAVVPLERCFRPILYQRGDPPFAAERER
ncbi:MAG: hypothetical protein JXR37_37030 [Kiritimatiellae bacterium]|nr:hypothetical protein [Kiritimatiellia bacterium]